MTGARKIFYLARHNVVSLVRDPAAFVLMMLLPFAIILVVGVAFDSYQRVPLGVVRLGDGELSARLDRQLADERAFQIHSYPDEDALSLAIRRHTVVAGIVIPSSYDRAIASGETVFVPFLFDAARSYPVAIRTTLAYMVNQEATVGQAAAVVARETGTPFDRVLPVTATAAAAPTGVELQVTSIQGESAIPLGFDYTAPGNLFLFMFLSSLGAAALMVVGRTEGYERRILGTPTSSSIVVVGDTVGRVTIALLQASVIVIVGAVVFDVSWGPTGSVALLVFEFAVVSAAAGQLMGTLVRTPEQAIAATSVLGIVLGMLGGCMWPLAVVTPAMRTLGHISPHAWAMDAAVELQRAGAGLSDAAQPLLVLGAFAAVLLTLSVSRLRAIVS